MRYAIEPELPADHAEVRAVHLAAFPTPVEANLVDLLRANGHAIVSLVARIDPAGGAAAGDRLGGTRSTIVGHVLFSPVTVERDGVVVARGLGLAPLAVMPARHGQGIGSALARAGLDTCRRLATAAGGPAFCVVLGAPVYYARFGFERASDHGVDNEYGVRDEFMVIPLGGARLERGLARYGDEFRTL